MFNKKIALILMGLLLVGIAATLKLSVSPAKAAPPTQEDPPLEEEGDRPSNNYCLLCHAQEGQVWNLPSGETLSLTVDSTLLDQSVHGSERLDEPLICADCHVNYLYPHPQNASQSIREFKLERYAACRTCHEDQYLHAQDSAHSEAVQAGQIDAAVCVDCHGGHDIQSPAEPRERISLTCGQCHGAIFEEYRTSIHGKALLEEHNEDVPTCVDCHGVHDISNPSTAEFRVRSPQVCADCHADADLMKPYEISPHVVDSYLTDFHGTTVALFEQHDEADLTNKAVCYDCHEVHNIQPVEDGAVIRENLLLTCRQCHPEAKANFPDAWVGHYEPTLKENPLLVTVKQLYKFLIPMGGGLFAIFIGTDLFRRILGGR